MRITCHNCPRTVTAGEECECGGRAPEEDELLSHADQFPRPPDDVGSGGYRPLPPKGDPYA